MGTVTLDNLKLRNDEKSNNKAVVKKKPVKRKSLKKFESTYKNQSRTSDEKDEEIEIKVEAVKEVKVVDEVEDLKRELELLRQQNKQLQEGNRLTKNEEKVLSAIRSESIKQGTEKPLISSRMFRKDYKVSSDYFRDSIDKLLSKQLIEREEAKFSGKVRTYRWKIIQQ